MKRLLMAEDWCWCAPFACHGDTYATVADEGRA